jgi:hypothetical protein
MWGDESQHRLMTTRRARRQSANCGSEKRKRRGGKRLGAEDEKRPLFLPMRSFIASVEEE